jgi:hypothetical protein
MDPWSRFRHLLVASSLLAVGTAVAAVSYPLVIIARAHHRFGAGSLHVAKNSRNVSQRRNLNKRPESRSMLIHQ